MEYVFEIKTPIGTGAIAYGKFMPKDGRRNQYHCWWSGCGIGGRSNTLEKAQEYLKEHIKRELMQRLAEYTEKETDIRIFLREFT